MRFLKYIAVLALLSSGCVNMYTRCPGTAASIMDTYQCTDTAWSITWITAFPQIMAPMDSGGFMAENLLTIPLSLIPAADTVCEAAIDTVCWPFDRMIADSRKTAEKPAKQAEPEEMEY